jgi:DNA-binding CsgD family transcriptional regulator
MVGREEPVMTKSLRITLPSMAATLFALIAVLIVVDIANDLAVGTTVFHVLFELLLGLAAAVGAFLFWNRLRSDRQATRNLKRNLQEAHSEATRWQEEEHDLLNNLWKVVNKQFTNWEFSPTDKEIAIYLLKGLSLKEIALLRGTTCASTRQQAYLIYRKAGLGGRAELSAFFLRGLLQSDVAPNEATSEPES